MAVNVNIVKYVQNNIIIPSYMRWQHEISVSVEELKKNVEDIPEAELDETMMAPDNFNTGKLPEVVNASKVDDVYTLEFIFPDEDDE